jgi:hypothetical protein
MDLKKFKFPEVTGVDVAFPTFDTIPELLKEAQKRGFDDHYNPYCKLFSNLFFNGGKVQFKPDVDTEYVKKVWTYCRSFMGSWSPKHEHKQAICAMLMSEILLPELDK